MTKLVYCATPSRLSERKEEFMDFATKNNYAPFHPFQAFEYERFEGGPIGREKTMEYCLRAVEICDEFWLFGISEGTLTELDHALEKGNPSILLYERFDPAWKENYKQLSSKFGNPLMLNLS